MLLVKAVAKKSVIHGKGLYAEELIRAGTVVWRFVPGRDHAYSKEHIQNLPPAEREMVLSLFHAYVSRQSGRYIVPGDDARHMNHASDPNVGVRYEQGIEEDVNFALRTILPGEELTIDYRDFAVEGIDFL